MRDNAAIQAGTVQAGTGRIRGRVLSADTKAVLRRAQVTISAPEVSIRRLVTTDNQGRYDFTELPASRYTISASKGGYVTLDYGQRRPFEPGTPVALANAQDLTQVDIALPRGSVIAGRVTDEFGEPIAGASILVQRYQYRPGGVRQLTFVPGANGVQGPMGTVDPLGLVDEDGNFQVRGIIGTVFFRGQIPPGWMLKSVTLEGEDITDTPLDLTGGERIEGLRIVLTDRLTDVSGGVSSEGGQPVKDYVVVLQPATPKQGTAANRYVRNARPDQDGRFRVRGMPTGEYIATAVESLEAGREWDPEYQPKLREAGRTFSLKEGDTIALDLRLAEGL